MNWTSETIKALLDRKRLELTGVTWRRSEIISVLASGLGVQGVADQRNQNVAWISYSAAEQMSLVTQAPEVARCLIEVLQTLLDRYDGLPPPAYVQRAATALNGGLPG